VDIVRRDYPELPQPAGAFHHSTQWGNLLFIAGHQDLELDAMIQRQASEFEPVRRGEMLKEIQRRVLEQAYLFSPVTGASRWVFDPQVQGFHPNTALSEYFYWSRVWLDR